ncbi:flagellar type III secretion system protein FliR [Rhizobiaceae bacterium BDR2-2]|uniref:Flagellar biosynthetic protein FliR n=1 Tax=Ectorhizobium quercum TaxID=2965071 RepID=A0AAE3SXS6_9HYPH|nr:flagellar biosynthetic protein FliR [Ectorhizobium quercum]MCX8996131.1 flagellar type III secretion system protein FliR [Ectorhizobium quercum]MCX8998830.1 flagellar type III secretion system protein FliR [Ectorhizobium quercum]
MITDPQGSVLALFLLFCRIGSCFMVLPGFASARIPVMIRLMVSLAVTMAILPLMWDMVYPRINAADPGAYVVLIVSESLIGVMFGMIARLYVLGLQFTGAVIGSSMMLMSPGGTDILEETAETALTNMITFTGLMVLFLLDFHQVVMKALIDSYDVMPVGTLVSGQKMLITLTDTLSQVFMIMLRLASPFLIFGIMFNFAVGLINKLSPQIPIYFIATPFSLMAGIFLLYLAIAAMLRLFADGFGPVFIGQ